MEKESGAESMTITIKLDLDSPRKAQQDKVKDKPRGRQGDKERSARLQCWLDEDSRQSPWNVLVDARPHLDSAI
jgi:hypothetical protein